MESGYYLLGASVSVKMGTSTMEHEDPKLEALIRELEAAQQQDGDPIAKAERIKRAEAALEAYKSGGTTEHQPID
jgi:hypothetical protein